MVEWPFAFGHFSGVRAFEAINIVSDERMVRRHETALYALMYREVGRS